MKRLNSISRAEFNGRRLRAFLLMALLFGLLLWSVRAFETNLFRSAFVSGYLLIAVVVFLAAFNLRKWLSFLPQIGSAAVWMQCHIYAGLFSGLIFALHVSWRIPDGGFETLLAGLFAATFLSGCYGLLITRILPAKLASLREQVIYEHIPTLRHQLVLAARDLMSKVSETNDSLQRFFVNRVARFLVAPRSLMFAMQPSNRECRRLVSEIAAMDRYLSPEDREVSRSLMQIVREKDDLDYHWAIQSRLKYWLFVHIGLTISLLVCAGLHVVMAHAFSGGIR